MGKRRQYSAEFKRGYCQVTSATIGQWNHNIEATASRQKSFLKRQRRVIHQVNEPLPRVASGSRNLLLPSIPFPLVQGGTFLGNPYNVRLQWVRV